MSFSCLLEEEGKFGFEILGVFVEDDGEDFVDVPGGEDRIEVFILVVFIFLFEVFHSFFLQSEFHLLDDLVVLYQTHQNVEVFLLLELYSLVDDDRAQKQIEQPLAFHVIPQSLPQVLADCAQQQLQLLEPLPPQNPM